MIKLRLFSLSVLHIFWVIVMGRNLDHLVTNYTSLKMIMAVWVFKNHFYSINIAEIKHNTVKVSVYMKYFAGFTVI